MGRFISRDPLGYVDGMCLYEPFGGNPGSFRDPLGTDFHAEWAELQIEQRKKEPGGLHLNFTVGMNGGELYALRVYQLILSTPGFRLHQAILKEPVTYDPVEAGFKDILEQTQKAVEQSQRKIQTLGIYGHSGTPGEARFYYEDIETGQEHKQILSGDCNFPAEAEDFFKYLKKSMCADGEIFINQCAAGLGDSGTKLLYKIAQRTNVKVTAPTGTYNTVIGAYEWKTVYPNGVINVYRNPISKALVFDSVGRGK